MTTIRVSLFLKEKIAIKITERGEIDSEKDDIYMMKNVKEQAQEEDNEQGVTYCLTDRNMKKLGTSDLLKKSTFSKFKGSSLKKEEEKKNETIEKKDVEDDYDEEGLCFVCFCNDANVVFLDCGHGGVCLECAMDTIKRNNICALCRENVNQIIEIDPKIEIRNGLYKVLNSYYVSKEEPKDDRPKEPGNVCPEE